MVNLGCFTNDKNEKICFDFDESSGITATKNGFTVFNPSNVRFLATSDQYDPQYARNAIYAAVAFMWINVLWIFFQLYYQENPHVAFAESRSIFFEAILTWIVRIALGAPAKENPTRGFFDRFNPHSERIWELEQLLGFFYRQVRYSMYALFVLAFLYLFVALRQRTLWQLVNPFGSSR